MSPYLIFAAGVVAGVLGVITAVLAVSAWIPAYEDHFEAKRRRPHVKGRSFPSEPE